MTPEDSPQINSTDGMPLQPLQLPTLEIPSAQPEIQPDGTTEAPAPESDPLGNLPLEALPGAEPVAAQLQLEIAQLQQQRDRLQAEIYQTQTQLSQLVQTSLQDLEQRRQALQTKVEKLEKRQEVARQEMRTSFAGSAQEVALRLQSFKEYLVGSLQDLTSSAEALELEPPPSRDRPRDPLDRADRPVTSSTAPSAAPSAAQSAAPSEAAPRFSEGPFQEPQIKKIRRLLELYRSEPDYYAPPWQLRRTFEAIHLERTSNWFFTQGGRGALRTLGSRLQNILVASAAISVLSELYGDRLRVMVLGQSPERLGDWRRGLQDCLGLRRDDFSLDRGVGLFEDPEPLALRADRMVKEKLLPLIIFDESEEYISLSLLQFPLWLAFAPNPQDAIAENSYRY